VTPGFGLAKGKVDEVRVQTSGGRKGKGSGIGDGDKSSKEEVQTAIRLPPGMKRPGSGNL